MNANDVMLATAEGLVALFAGLYLAMPRLGRPGLWFGVTVEPAFRDTAEARRTERDYRARIVVHSLVAAVLAWAAVARGWAPLASLATFWQIGGALAAYLHARRRTLPHAAPEPTVREASLAPRASGLPGGLGAQLGPFLIIAACAVALALHYPELPDTIPVHWGPSGAPNRFAEKSFLSVFMPLVIGVLLCGLQLVMARATLRSRAVETTGERAQAERRFRRIMSGPVLLSAEYLLALVMALTRLPLLGVSDRVLLATLPLTLVFLAVVLVLSIRAGQGGSRLTSAPAMPGDKTADRAWKWGVFYCDRRDSALFVEKRFGVGYTVNFGNPWAWVVIAALLGVIAISIVTSVLAS